MNDETALTGNSAGDPEGSGPATEAAPARDAGRRLDSRTLWEQVRDRLREDILAGDLAPGTVLSEVALAESFGVSRGPIREALGRLASEGLVTITPRRGAIVTELTRDEFIDAYQVREAFETLAIRLAVPRLDEADLALLRELHEQMAEHVARGDVNAFFETNGRFHELFLTASGNRKLHEMYRLLMDQTGRYQARSLALRGSIERSVAEHGAILEAVEAGDAEAAVRLLADHIEVPQRVVEETSGTQDAPEEQPAPSQTTSEGEIR
jgi:DNA-binding GntR family transcriptional regulator